MALKAHLSMQLKHVTHLDVSIFLSLVLMHPALHDCTHLPQDTHLSLFILIAKSGNQENNERMAPVGQKELQ